MKKKILDFFRFRRSKAIASAAPEHPFEELVEEAIREHVAFEAVHSAPFGPDQRVKSILQRAARIAKEKGSAVPTDDQIRPLVVAAMRVLGG